MKMKSLAIIITAMTVSTMFLVSLAYAQVPTTVNIYAWTDKTYYDLGEKGVLHIVIRNDRTDEDLILKNLTITYPWFGYTGEEWEGNDTITPDVALLKDGGVYSKSVEFDVPTDGKATGGSITIIANVDKWPDQYFSSVSISIKSTPWYMSFEDVDKIVTLFTVQTVLIIVCTIIIAATIFLSGRRPQVTWREPEKAA